MKKVSDSCKNLDTCIMSGEYHCPIPIIIEGYRKDFEGEGDVFYLILDNGRIGYISSICMCEECIDRRETEVFIHSLNGEYLDCIKFSYLFDEKNIMNMGRSIEDLSNKHTQAEINQMVAEMYEKELRKVATNN